MKHKIVAAALAVAALGPAAAAAHADSLGDQLAAGDQTARALTHRYPRWTWVATCRPVSRTKFTCQVMGNKGSRLAFGRSYVTKRSSYTFSAKITSLNFN